MDNRLDLTKISITKPVRKLFKRYIVTEDIQTYEKAILKWLEQEGYKM